MVRFCLLVKTGYVFSLLQISQVVTEIFDLSIQIHLLSKFHANLLYYPYGYKELSE